LEELSWRLLEKLLSLRELPAGSMEFARQGARQVLVLARSRDALEHLAQEIAPIGSQAIPMPCDITQTEQVHIAIAQGWRDHGPIDILVNCAGIAHQQMFLQFHPRQLQEEISVNLLGLVTITRAVARRMAKQRQGLIVNVSSLMVDIPPCLKAGDSCYWFCDSTYHFGFPLHGSGAYLPSRSPFRGSSLLPKGTVTSTKKT
jgi:hypothetical protein